MRTDAARADRALAVRSSAAGWRRAGAIDDATLRAIVTAYPDDRNRLGLGLRILAGCAAFFGGGALCGLIASFLSSSFSSPEGTTLVLGLAVLFAVATELQVGPLRRAQAGAEYATALLAATCAGLAPLPTIFDDSLTLASLAFALAFAVAAWRWGYALFAALSAMFVLLSCTTVVSGRSLWLALGALALPLILGAARSPRWAPAHRRSFTAVGLVFLAGGYIAANVYGLDHRWSDWIGQPGPTDPGAWARRAAIAGTILIPPIVLGLGIRFRDRWLLVAGAVFTAASLVTLRRYHPVGPWWFSLIIGGGTCLALAVLMRRWLIAGPGRERWGFTAEPLFEDRRLIEAARVAATVLAVSPGARTTSEEPFTGGGGRSGGGGATGQA